MSVEPELARELVARPAACRLPAEQTEGPYHREVHPERRDITEDRDGLGFLLGLRFLAAEAGTPIAGAVIEVWHADKDGRYSGFAPFRPPPGQVVTSDTVPRDVVAPGEGFLRGSQRTDAQGLCAFTTIYPGWYASRTVHIHLRAHLPGGRSLTTQLYFPDATSDEVFSRPPYAGRPRRDTTNATDSIFAGGGEQTMLSPRRRPAGLTGTLCMAIDERRS